MIAFSDKLTGLINEENAVDITDSAFETRHSHK